MSARCVSGLMPTENGLMGVVAESGGQLPLTSAVRHTDVTACVLRLTSDAVFVPLLATSATSRRLSTPTPVGVVPTATLAVTTGAGGVRFEFNAISEIVPSDVLATTAVSVAVLMATAVGPDVAVVPTAIPGGAAVGSPEAGGETATFMPAIAEPPDGTPAFSTTSENSPAVPKSVPESTPSRRRGSGLYGSSGLFALFGMLAGRRLPLKVTVLDGE